MKTQKCLPMLSLAVSGLLIGATQAVASPLLDSDLASFTVLGAYSESHVPRNAGEGAVGHSDIVQAIVALNASAAGTGLPKPMTGSERGVGSDVMQLAQSLHLARIGNSGREALTRHVSTNEPGAEAGNQARSPTRDNRNFTRKYLCTIAQASLPVAAFDPAFCNDAAAPNDFRTVAATPEIAANPSSEQSANSPQRTISDQDTGDLQQALLLATLPNNPGPNSDNAGGESTARLTQSASPDIATALAAFPSALAINELAVTLPEPGTLLLLGLGLAGMGYSRKRTA